MFDSADPNGGFTHHEYFHEMSCGTSPDGAGWNAKAAADVSWTSYMILDLFQDPLVGDHHEADFGVLWHFSAVYDAERPVGGSDCYIDIVDAQPGIGGYFECAGMAVSGPGPSYLVDVSDGAFRCL